MDNYSLEAEATIQQEKESYYTLDKVFNPKSNSIGFLRLFLAIIVIFSHTYLLGGFGEEALQKWSYDHKILGNIAVDCFFALSGFLITGSYMKSTSKLRYLWHRILRIFPGYWVCLIVTALVIGSIVYFFQQDINTYFQADNSPWNYIKANFWLQRKQIRIANLFNNVPYPIEVNGSLWTLGHEFRCYIFVLFFGILGLLRIRKIVLGLLILLLSAYTIQKLLPGTALESLPFFALHVNGIYTWSGKMLWLYFLGGMVFHLYKQYIPINTRLVIVSTGMTFLGLKFGFYDFIAVFTVTYILFWLAIHLPVKSFEEYARGDYSYGLYIYSFPIQQMLSSFGLNKYGFGIYFLSSLAISLALAILSWHFVEKPLLSLKKVNLSFFKNRFKS